MSLRLLYITNDVDVAQIAQRAGVDALFLDLEILGKSIRQGHLDTVISKHTVDDVRKIRRVLNSSKLLVRVNPLNPGSEDEINEVIDAGADILMLPMFQSRDEAGKFIRFVDGRAETCLLVETPAAVNCIDDILTLPGIDSIHIGLNDLHLAYGMKFMFELLTDGTVEMLCRKISAKGIKYGFGGIARLGYGTIPAEYIIAEHYRLGSCQAILSRSFCNADNVEKGLIRSLFMEGVKEIRAFEHDVEWYTPDKFSANNHKLKELITQVTANKHEYSFDRCLQVQPASVR